MHQTAADVQVANHANVPYTCRATVTRLCMDNPLNQQIRNVVLEHGRLGEVSDLRDDTDLYSLGLTSHASVAVMLALEATFDFEFPDRFLTRQVFESVQNIAHAVTELLGESQAAGFA
jgi:acyl carrier protein